MTKVPSSCPFCNTPYATRGGQVTMGFGPDGKVGILCPRCGKAEPISGPTKPGGVSGFFRRLFGGR